MKQETKPVAIQQFPGLATNADPLDIPPGAATVQVNVTSIKNGQLETRKGMRDVVFDN